MIWGRIKGSVTLLWIGYWQGRPSGVGYLDFYQEVEGTSMLLQMAEFLSFLRLNNISLHGHNTFSLPIRSSMDTEIVSMAWLLGLMLQ